jgi:hypothetical protein
LTQWIFVNLFNPNSKLSFQSNGIRSNDLFYNYFLKAQLFVDHKHLSLGQDRNSKFNERMAYPSYPYLGTILNESTFDESTFVSRETGLAIRARSSVGLAQVGEASRAVVPANATPESELETNLT